MAEARRARAAVARGRVPAGGLRRGVQLQSRRPQGALGGLHGAGRSSVGAVHVRRRGRDGEQGSVRRDAARQARGLDPHQEHPGTPGEGGNHGGDERRGVD